MSFPHLAAPSDGPVQFIRGFITRATTGVYSSGGVWWGGALGLVMLGLVTLSALAFSALVVLSIVRLSVLVPPGVVLAGENALLKLGTVGAVQAMLFTLTWKLQISSAEVLVTTSTMSWPAGISTENESVILEPTSPRKFTDWLAGS